MTNRFWLAAPLAGLISATPIALVLHNLGVLSGHSRVAGDLTSGMIYLGLGLIGLGGLVQAPFGAAAMVSVKRRAD